MLARSNKTGSSNATRVLEAVNTPSLEASTKPYMSSDSMTECCGHKKAPFKGLRIQRFL